MPRIVGLRQLTLWVERFSFDPEQFSTRYDVLVGREQKVSIMTVNIWPRVPFDRTLKVDGYLEIWHENLQREYYRMPLASLFDRWRRLNDPTHPTMVGKLRAKVDAIVKAAEAIPGLPENAVRLRAEIEKLRTEWVSYAHVVAPAFERALVFNEGHTFSVRVYVNGCTQLRREGEGVIQRSAMIEEKAPVPHFDVELWGIQTREVS